MTQKKDLFSLNNIVLDIDCHSSAVTRQQLDNAIDNLLSLAKSDLEIPLWNLAHKTGRGVQLWWCMEQVSKSLSFLYQATQGRFLNKYNELDILEIDTTYVYDETKKYNRRLVRAKNYIELINKFKC